DVIYTIGETSDGIKTMTVNPDYSGMKYFGVQVTPVIAHEGLETVVFTQWRDDTQLAIAAIRADFNIVQAPLPEAQVGFNVQSGDIIKVCVFDQLSNDADRNPVPFQ
ncbi:MAG TPA: metallophosphoesterase, partial [Gelria sp.]|nr:metallophosphoesterase [Gelria sp.]